ncbi:TniQ family protein [Vogesella amnigena]|uniref:TniQ family protein n=1 Tax=Vogesella amnigena TaxID=1507449 RepID=A0ABV7TVX7_9NEIS
MHLQNLGQSRGRVISRSPYPILTRLPDETLFSWVSRLDAFWGLPSTNLTCLVLFGHFAQAICHAFPDHLARFAMQVGVDGSPTSLFTETTLLSFYRPFLSRGALESAERDLLLGWGKSLAKRLGWLAYHKWIHHPLKACPDCIEEDHRQTGWSYWHQVHQWPGVWVCPKHGVPLHVLEPCNADTHELVLPLAYISHLRPVALPEQLLEPSRALAHFISGVVHERFVIQPEVLLALYYQQAASHGWINDAGQMQWVDAASSYIAHCHHLTAIPERHFLPETIQSSGRVLYQVFRDEGLALHPLRHLLVMYWLWGDVSAFWRDYCHCSRMPQGLVHAAKFDPPVIPKELPLQRELEALYAAVQGNLADMAEILGISLLQLRKQFRLHGIPMSASVAVEPSEWTLLLGSGLDKGMSSLELSKLLKLPRTQICAAIHRDRALLTRWQDGRRNLQVEKARKHFASLDISSCFEAKPLPLLLDQKLCWFLIRQDRAWLLGHLQRRVRVWAQFTTPGVGLSEADVSLCAQMLLYSIRSRLFPAFKFVNSRGAFCRHIPGFSSLGRRLCHFPLSQSLLASLTAPTEA